MTVTHTPMHSFIQTKAIRIIAIPIALVTFSLCLAGCESSRYYYQVAEGHIKVMAAREPIKDLIVSGELPAKEITQLKRVMELRSYAETELLLPVGNHYSEYVDLKRPHVVWNVIAAPEFSMTPQKWCFPIAGCVNYKGYFSEASAEEYAAQLNDNNIDTYVGGVAAYSTLGWFDDPVLNTFLFRGDASLAGLLFHELSHKLLYIKGDSVFNESFATTIEIEGLMRWLKTQSKTELLAKHLTRKERHQQFIDLILQHRERRVTLYKSAINDTQKRLKKQEFIEALREEYHQLKELTWLGYSGYDKWFEDPLNNAQLSTIATYNALVTGFQGLLKQNNNDLSAFYQQCKELIKLDKKSRHAYLKSISTKA
jgi:predicted aminopeptidase